MPSAHLSDGLVNTCSTMTLLMFPVMSISTLVSSAICIKVVLSSNLKSIEPDSASFTGLDCFSEELELAIARFVAKRRRRKIEKIDLNSGLSLGRVMVSYICEVKILLYKSMTSKYRFDVLLMNLWCRLTYNRKEEKYKLISQVLKHLPR